VDFERQTDASHSHGLAASKLLGLVVLAMLAGSLPAASEQPSMLRHANGAHVETDGMLTDKQARRLSRATTPARRARMQQAQQANDTSSFWLFDYLGRMLDDEPVAAQRPRRSLRVLAASTAPPQRTVPAHSPQPAASNLAAVPAQRPAVAAVAVPVAVINPIVTGALSPGRTALAPAPEAQDAIIVAAERSQARIDLVKLELASRTYDERKLSGQQVFELRNDWRVLERSKDAFTGAELTSAIASGFEANAYINETTRTIVVAVAGSQDLRRDFLSADVWKALIKAEAPQQFYLAKTYARSVIQRYQLQGYSTECVGHSLGGGACAYAAAELGIRALVLNPISAGKLPAPARFLVTNYIVDGEIASLVYGARGNEFSGNLQVINDGRDMTRLMALEKYGQLAGPILVIRELRASIQTHKVETALDLVAAQAETARPK
jgi:hypothetical protein